MFVEKILAIQTEIEIFMMFGSKKENNIVVSQWNVVDYTLVRSANNFCTVFVAECE